ncbi:MAG: glycosyltransferase [Chitinophagales bacterium]
MNQKKLKKGEIFIHYPAQFWSHKNHYNLLLAFKVIIKYPNLKLILTGSNKGNKAYIINLINHLDLSQKVIDLGFISREELKWLYLNSFGLVMPTFLEYHKYSTFRSRRT